MSGRLPDPMPAGWRGVAIEGDATDRQARGWHKATLEWKIGSKAGWIVFYGPNGGRHCTKPLTANEARQLGRALLSLADAIEAVP